MNIDVNMWLGTSAKSSTMAAQNSTLVSRTGRVDVREARLAQPVRGLQRPRSQGASNSRAVRRSTRARGIPSAVDAVAEAHEAITRCRELLDVALCISGALDFSIIPRTRLGAPPCSGPLHSADCSGDGRSDVGTSGGNDSGSEG